MHYRCLLTNIQQTRPRKDPLPMEKSQQSKKQPYLRQRHQEYFKLRTDRTDDIGSKIATPQTVILLLLNRRQADKAGEET